MAEKIRRKVKRNNNGSTMVIVLIMLSFIMILATVVTSSTIMNLKMKVADKQSTKTFYTSEDAVNEVYVAMGQVSADCFNKAYQDEIAEVVESTAAGNMTVDNITCNENLRLNYAHRILNKLGFIKDSDLEGIKHTYSDYVSKKQEGTFVRAGNTVEGLGVADALNKCIEDTHKDAEGNPTLSIESVDNIQVVSKVSSASDKVFYYTVNINNCLVKYLTEAGYYSYITFDMSMGIPDELVNITDSKKLNLDSFVKYAIIGNKGISVASSSNFTLNGNAFAGYKNGFKVNAGGSANINGGNLLATSGNIVVENGMFTAGSDSKIWCENLKTADAAASSSGSTINVSGSSDTYVKDDLELNGNGSNVSLSGNYYGYGYVSVNGTERLNPSSAIIINSKNSSLNLTGLNKLMVAGRAYVDYLSLASNGNGVSVPEGYDTGESVSFIGDQEIYLVPASLMGGSNPVMLDTAVTVDINENNFFGYKYLGADDGGNLYVKKTINIEGDPVRDFYYLRFKNEESAASYVRAIFDDDEFNGLLDGKTDDTKKLYKEQREKLKTQMTLNASSMNSVLTVGSGEVYSKTTMLSASSSSGKMNLSYVASTGGASNSYNFKRDYDNLSARFNVLCKTLYEITDSGYMTDALVGQMYPNLSAYSEDVYVNMISDRGFKAYTEGKLGPVNNRLTGGYAGYVLSAYDNGNTGADPLIISDEDVALSNRRDITYSFRDYNGGIIVASGDVIVKKNFSGSIIAGGTITIEDNVTVNGLSDITDIIKTDQKYAEIFKVWNPLEDGNNSGFLDVQNMTYKDMITVANWRKRDDSVEATASSTEPATN